MTGQDLIALRLASQQLTQPGFAHPGELVAYLGAVQAQDYNGAKWSLGVRLPGSTDHSIEEALKKREIVRTWAFRGTLFFVSPGDLRWIVSLVGWRVIDSIKGRYRQLELDEGTLNRCSNLIVKALQDRPELTRKTLLAMLEANSISTRSLRAPHILQRASLEGLVCQTVALRNDPTYILMDSLASSSKNLAHDEAIVELAKRYFTSHGPAVLQDFAWWLGLPLAEARIGWEAIQSQLIPEDIGGQKYWHSPSDSVYNSYAQGVYLLPAADEYLLGYKDRSPILDAYHAKMLSQGNGLNPFIVKDGRVAGTWRRSIGKKEVLLKINASAKFNRAERENFQESIRRYCEYMEMPVKVI